MKKKLSKTDYFELSYKQQLIETKLLKINLLEEEINNKYLRRRIQDLEVALMQNKLSLLKSSKTEAEKDLNKLRDSIAKKLNLKSLNEYIIDTDSLELVHQDDI